MNKIGLSGFYKLLFLFITAASILFPACRKEKMGAPVITSVRNYEAAPNDTVVTTVYTGQWVILLGENLGGVTEVYFGSVPATINTALFAQGSLVVQIPSIPFQSVPGDKLNEITVVSEAGRFTFVINVTGPPIITHVRNFATSPNDTIASAIYPSQEINLVGYNLKNAISITFQGVAANLSSVVYTDTSAIVQVPSDLSGSDATLANTITYTTNFGTGTFSIQIIGPPIITSVSYENPNTGDSVYLYGNNFFSIQSLTFAGSPVASFVASDDGTSVGFVAPTLTQSGPVVITTQAGTFTTAYNVNDITTGVVSNFEWGPLFQWAWWGGAELTSGDPGSGWPPYDAAFTGNPSMFLMLKNNILNTDEGADWSHAIRMENVQWLPEANVGDPAGSWALKFEINVPNGWNGGSIVIKSSDGTYIYRYEPWQVSSNNTAAFSTKGWQTVTIPLSSFRRNDATLGDGRGTPIAAISDLVGSTGKSHMLVYMHNYSTSPTATAFKAAFDNFRVVKR